MSGNGWCSVVAKITFKNQNAYMLKWQQLEEAFLSTEQLGEVVYAGANIVADQIRRDLERMPEENFRFLKDGDIFGATPEGHRKDLEESFGLTPIKRDKKGFLHTKVGFDGYGSYPTREYPNGLPNVLLARAIESGSSVRRKIPFIGPAVQKTRTKAISAMAAAIDEKFENIFKGG